MHQCSHYLAFLCKESKHNGTVGTLVKKVTLREGSFSFKEDAALSITSCLLPKDYNENKNLNIFC